ncbi:MAG TPA: NAD-dependent epimerase/dehydratase family protein [Anaeromyxobacteraceae bacterium]|nr:NAD-dependent epimerase/dehydratase family protein [Anaeromyxobacteraceae bacterium]
MRVFMTGASGYVGGAVAAALVRAGHQVTALSRWDGSDEKIRKVGATPVRGALGAVAAARPAMAGHDAYVHAAVDYGLGPPSDREAVDALLAAARAEAGPTTVLYTSGVWVLGATGAPAGEDAPTPAPAAAVAWRPAHEQLVLGAAGGNVATAVVRPGIVYGEKRGLVSPWFEQGRSRGWAEVVGDGTNRWALVHREDLADLYLRVLERRASGVFHGVDGAAPRIADAAAAACRAAGGSGEVRSKPLEEARKALGPMADALAMDQVVVAPRAASLGWKPRRASFLAVVAAAAAEAVG